MLEERKMQDNCIPQRYGITREKDKAIYANPKNVKRLEDHP